MLDFSQPGLAVFDMDSTLIRIECIDEIAAIAGCKPQVEAITAAAMRGEVDFAASLTQRVALLKGVEEATLGAIFSPPPLTQGAAELIQWLQQRGWKTAVVSGGFTWFAEQLKQLIQLDTAIANQLEIENGRLTGRVLSPIIDAQAKADHLQRLAQWWGISPANTLAVGDGANDIPMLERAAFGVAFQAKNKVKQHAQLAIDDTDLMTIARYFEAQGLAWQK
jgi:phosphoserine phosphatase